MDNSSWDGTCLCKLSRYDLLIQMCVIMWCTWVELSSQGSYYNKWHSDTIFLSYRLMSDTADNGGVCKLGLVRLTEWIRYINLCYIKLSHLKILRRIFYIKTIHRNKILRKYCIYLSQWCRSPHVVQDDTAVRRRRTKQIHLQINNIHLLHQTFVTNRGRCSVATSSCSFIAIFYNYNFIIIL